MAEPSPEPNLVQVTPFLRVSDMDEAVGFYQDVLGFADIFKMDDPPYAFLKRDTAAIRLMRCDPDFDLTRPEAQQVIYIDVDNIDALHAELADRLKALPEERYRPLFDTFYGQREFHVIDPDTTLIMFGSKIVGPLGADAARQKEMP